MLEKIVIAVLAVVLVLVVVVGGWTAACYNYCPPGSSLQITNKTGKSGADGRYAKEDQMGVREQMLGPGRHFWNPWNYTLGQVRNIKVEPGMVCVVMNKIGKKISDTDRFLARPDEKGTQMEVLTPGIWRINTFGQTVKPVPAIEIKPGYVGVQTLQGLGGGKDGKGILPTVLQPGYYNINPEERRVDPVEIGYRVWPSTAALKKSGVTFPLADGKQMTLEFTVVWGIFPKEAPRIIREYGGIDKVEKKVIEPQVMSICKNAGSNLTTQQFIQGKTRQEFQEKVTESLKKIGEEKGIHFMIALVRGFHADETIRKTIQAQKIAEEEKITLKIEQQRGKVAAELEKAERKLQIALSDFDAETEAKVQEENEKGIKKAAEIQALANREVAALQRQSAELDAQITRIAGQARADVIEATKRAEATRLELLIKAYGGATPYNLATFAEYLPKDIQIEYRYAGEGTFWTDAAGSMKDNAAKVILNDKNNARGKP